MSLTAEEIERNWTQFRALLEKVGDRSSTALAMVDALGERLALCPASAKRDFHCAFPGGLVDHSLRVLKNTMTMNKAFEWNLPRESMIIGALFHDLGKVGDHEHDYYVPQTDGWRQDKLGEMYTYNDKLLPYMGVPDRSVFLCQHYGLKLSHDEMLALKLNDGFVVEENKKYCLKAPKLAIAVMTADYISSVDEKNSWPTG